MGNTPPDDDTRLINGDPSQAGETKFLPPSDDPMQMIGNYEVLRSLGEGGMGTVYLGRDPDLHREVAIKMVRPELIGSEEYVTRMMREARLCARLNHPHIVQIYQVGRFRKAPYLVMEYVKGNSLHELLRTPPPLEIYKAIDIIAQCCLGLGVAAKQGIVHRDIKPANIMVTRDGFAKIMDFGLSKSISGDSMTMTSAIMGTPDFMPPEQAEGKVVDFRADMYALGITLFQCCTGYLPFRASTAMDTLMNQKTMPLPEDPTLKAIANGRLFDVIVWMTNKDPADRPTSYDDIRTHLLQIIDYLGSKERITIPVSVEYGPVTPKTGERRTPSSSKKKTPSRPTPKRKAIQSKPKTSKLPWLFVAGFAVLAAAGIVYTMQEGSSSPAAAESNPSQPENSEEITGGTGEGTMAVSVKSSNKGGDLESLLASIQSHGLNVVLDPDLNVKYEVAFHFDEANPKDILDLLIELFSWNAEDEDGIAYITQGGTPSIDAVRQKRESLGTFEYPKTSVSTIGGSHTLQDICEGFRINSGINYFIVPGKLAQLEMPSMGMTGTPLNTILQSIRRQKLENDFEWLYEDNILVIVPATADSK